MTVLLGDRVVLVSGVGPGLGAEVALACAREGDATALATVPLFAACSKKELQAIAKRAEDRTVVAGTELVREGAAGDAFYVIE